MNDMTDPIPDPIEIGENSVLKWSEEFVDGDYFICYCGARTLFSKGEPLSADPYAIPICPECVKKVKK